MSKTLVTALFAAAVSAVAAPPNGLTSSDWQQIRAEYTRHRHVVSTDDGGGYRAFNHRQGWRLAFDGRGFTARPDQGDWQWGLELIGYGVEGAAPAFVDPSAGRVEVDVNRLSRAWGDGLQEWYVNDVRGLEHGFTLERRPAGEGERLELRMTVRGELIPRAAEDGSALSFIDEAGASVVQYAGLKVFDATGRALAARLGVAASGHVSLTVDDRGAEYPITVDPIAQQAYLKASNPDAGDRFGWSVAVSGDTVVVGADGERGSGSGVNPPPDNNLVYSGAAYVFVRTAGAWSQQARLKASNPDAGDHFGHSVAVSGDTIVVGALFEAGGGSGVNPAPNNNLSSSGAAYVFVRTAGVWSEQAYLKASNPSAIDFFGVSVAVSGDTVVVGANGEDGSGSGVNPPPDNNLGGSGAAYVFVRAAGAWSQQAYLKASNPDGFDQFGTSVAVSGDTVVIGANGEDGSGSGVNPPPDDNLGDSGAAYVFGRTAGVWSEQAYLKASNPDVDDEFGWSVAVWGATVVVGAPLESGSGSGVNPAQDNNLGGSGAAYVFVRAAGVWGQQAYLKASNPDNFDLFGTSVAVSGDTVVVGAGFEGGSGSGVNPSPDNNLGESGAAYVFVREFGSWSQPAYLKASNPDEGDQFGHSVAVSGATVVVGANGEDGSGSGVNPVPGNNNPGDSGAAYVFDDVAACREPDAIGIYRNGTWFLDDGDFGFEGCAGDRCAGFGLSTDNVIVGDWGGEGTDEIGLFRTGQNYNSFFLDNGSFSWDGCFGGEQCMGLGLPGDQAVVGDFNGDGRDQLGLYRGEGSWFLDNGNLAWDGCFGPGAEICAGFGQLGDKAVVGDFNGDGKTQIGLFRNGSWFLDNGTFAWDGCATPGGETCMGLGKAGDIPIVGDFDGDGRDQIGVFRNGSWFIDNGNFIWDGCAPGVPNGDWCVGFGSATAKPLVGDFDGDGRDQIGVFQNGAWAIDNGNFTWDTCAVDLCAQFGQSGDRPVVGRWGFRRQCTAPLPATGPDAYGYRSAPISGRLRDIRATGTLVPDINGMDAAETTVGLGFGGLSATVTSDGVVDFSSQGGPLGSALYADLDPSAGGQIYVETRGTPGKREWILGFYDVPYKNGAPGETNTFEFIVHEGSLRVELQYGYVAASGGTVVIGLQQPVGGIALPQNGPLPDAAAPRGTGYVIWGFTAVGPPPI